MTNLKNIIDYMHNHEDKLVVEDYLNDYAKKNHVYIDDCHRIAIRQILTKTLSILTITIIVIALVKNFQARLRLTFAT